MSDETLEGWYTDPYDRHDARWMSDGVPTRLVRDGKVTSSDEPPGGPWVLKPEPWESESNGDQGSDLLRADAAESGNVYDSRQARWAAYDQLAAQPPSAFDDVGRRPPEQQH